MAIDLNGLSVADLEKLIVDARARIETVKKQQFSELRRALEAQARTAGFDIYELFSGGRSKAPALWRQKGSGAEIPRSGQCRADLDRSWQAAALGS